MPRVTILSRDETFRYPAPNQVEFVVSVAYSSPVFPPRIVLLPRASYRPATEAERRITPALTLVPVDDKAVQAERQAIIVDMTPFIVSPRPSFDF